MSGDQAVCAAHGLLVDNVNYIRTKQDETAEKVQGIAEGQIKLNIAVNSVQANQEQILRMLKKRKWTPARMTFFVASIFGSGSAFPKALSIILAKIGG